MSSYIHNWTSSTGENISRLMDTVLTSKEISWQNCVSFACDNANVMMGQHKGVVAYLHQKNPETFVVGCPCHLIALAAGKAANALPVKVDDFIIDIYFYLDKSSKRQQNLNSFMDEFNITMKKVTKHVVTRWLSLGKCIPRILHQWDALEAFFKSEVPAFTKKKRADDAPASSKKWVHEDASPNEPPAKKHPSADNEIDLAQFIFKQQVR